MEGWRHSIDGTLLVQARAAFGPRAATWFVVGGASAGKSTICAEIGRRAGIEVLDMDALLFGAWFGSFDAVRHPENHAWSAAPDPLAWQLALDPDAFAAFHAATTAEALDLLADHVADREPGAPLLVDGGFGRPAVLAAAVPPDRIACLALPASMRAAAWTDSADRRPFLGEVAAVTLPDGRDPLATFLALDDRLHEEMIRDARVAGIAVLERGPGTTVADLVGRVAAVLGIALR